MNMMKPSLIAVFLFTYLAIEIRGQTYPVELVQGQVNVRPYLNPTSSYGTQQNVNDPSDQITFTAAEEINPYWNFNQNRQTAQSRPQGIPNQFQRPPQYEKERRPQPQPQPSQFEQGISSQFDVRPNDPSRQETPTDLPVSDAITDFSLNMLQNLVRKNQYKNLVVSPISISVLMSLVHQGAEPGSLTDQEFNDVLKQTKETSRRTYKQIMTGIKDSKGANSILFANGMYLNKRNKFNLNTDTKNGARQYYLAQLENYDFLDSQQVANAINAFSNSNTKGYIPHLITAEAIRPESDCILVNSFYFKGTWKTKFEKERTRPRDFKRTPTYASPVDFMWANNKYQVNQDESIGAKWIALPFDGERFDMVFVLPIENHALNELIAKLDRNDFKKIMTQTYEHKTALGIPKFNLTQDSSMKEILYDMGIREVFTGNSKITQFTKSGKPITISSVTQKALISVDESGSISAAGTSLVVNTLSLPPPNETFVFRADEPFLAILVDKQNEIPLVIAKVNEL